jgi:hypothetical protein
MRQEHRPGLEEQGATAMANVTPAAFRLNRKMAEPGSDKK